MSFEQAKGNAFSGLIYKACTDCGSVMAIRRAMRVALHFMNSHVHGPVFPVLWNMAPATISVCHTHTHTLSLSDVCVLTV